MPSPAARIGPSRMPPPPLSGRVGGRGAFAPAAGALVAATGMAALLAAAACARYAPAPLAPQALADEYAARRLDAPDLRRFLAEHGSTAPDSGWRAADLALAALYYQPALDAARASWRSSRAAEVTAGARPRPEAQGELGYATTAAVFESRWLAAISAILTIELGGKRGARLAAARARTAVAEADLEETAWRTARGARDAVLELRGAEERLADETLALARVSAFAERLRRRYAEGTLSRSELAAVESEEADARAAVSRDRAAVEAARVALARAVGVTPAALARQGLVERDSIPSCEPAAPPESLVALALRRRPEVGRALAEYAVAEGDLRIAVAGSYPDLALGPGFTWDQGIARWSIFPALRGIPLDGNRGPIGEATARRAEAAARFEERQQQVVSEVQGALAGCRLALADVAGADSVRQATARQAALARAAYDRGEIAAVQLGPIELAETRALRELHAARRRLAGAAAALEAATGAWPAGPVRWPDPRIPTRRREAGA